MTDGSRRDFLLRFAATALAVAGGEALAEGRPPEHAVVYGPPRESPDDRPEYFNEVVGNEILFGAGSMVLDEGARAILDRQAAWLKLRPVYRVHLLAHADDKGTREYNLAVSDRRGEIVKAYLVGRGIAADRIDVLAFGRERPKVEGKGAKARAANRRVETLLAR